ncbi:MAG: hypothetical protein K8R35_04235, partial [Bacteroidales bacterium]|nr:hypothetical protein [Bacteroidales bacterium]
PIRSHRMAQYLHSTVPGIILPEKILSEFEKTDKSDQEKLGVDIALGIIESLKGIKEINGIHIMAVGWESVVPGIIADSGLKK